MKKRLLMLFAAVAATTLIAFGLSACDLLIPDDHVHEWSVWTHVDSGEVMTDGGFSAHERVCVRPGCGEREVWDCAFDEVAVAATCEEAGSHTHTCADCGYTYSHEVGTALGHDYSRFVYDAETETHYAVCTRNETHTLAPEPCEFKLIETVEPTCVAGGFKIYACETCGGQKTETTDADFAGHQWVYGAQSEENGIYRHERHCSVCLTEETQDCAAVYTTVDPTCTEAGVTTVSCDVCGNSTLVRTVEKLGHEWSEWVHTTEYDGHIGENYHTHECTRENCGEKEAEACVLVDADELPTCTKPGKQIDVCATCHYQETGEEIPQLFHDFGDWVSGKDGTHYHECRNCNERETENCADHFEVVTKDRTCTEPASITRTCTVCGYQPEPETIGEATGHFFAYRETATGHIAYCTVCDFEQPEKAHSYTETNFCVCGHDGLAYAKSGAVWTVTGIGSAAGAKNLVISAIHEGGYVTRIGSNAFAGNKTVETVVLPYTLTEIAQSAFENCEKLSAVSFDDADQALLASRLTLGTGAFRNCKLLWKVSFPESLAVINANAFSGCENLLTIELSAPVSEIWKGAFDGTAFYNDETNWVGGGLYLNNNLIVVKNEELTALEGVFTIRAGTAAVATSAFENCTNLVKVIIPETAVAFNYYAFRGCTNLASVEYQGGVAGWFSILFDNDEANPMYFAAALSLTNVEENVTIPESATRIPDGTFRGSQTVKEIVIPEGVTTIGAYAFYGCTNLERIVIPDSVVFIGIHAFDGTKVVSGEGEYHQYEDGLLYVGKHLIKAKNEEIPNSVTLKQGTLTIAPYAFENCTNLEAITFSAELVFIGAYTFKGCEKTLKTATFTRESGGYWFAWTEMIARSITDQSLYGKNAVNYFFEYPREWKHTNYAA